VPVLSTVILATWETEIVKNMVQVQPRQTVCETPISTITGAKWTGGVAHAVQHLFCKHEVLNSNPSPVKKKRKIKEMDTRSLVHP
jgi:hypothetical protein